MADTNYEISSLWSRSGRSTRGHEGKGFCRILSTGPTFVLLEREMPSVNGRAKCE